MNHLTLLDVLIQLFRVFLMFFSLYAGAWYYHHRHKNDIRNSVDNSAENSNVPEHSVEQQ